MDTRENVSYRLTLTNRDYLQTEGILEVESFDENEIMAASKLGPLTIKGHNMHIIQLNLEEGKLAVEGVIDSILYLPEKKGRMGA